MPRRRARARVASDSTTTTVPVTRDSAHQRSVVFLVAVLTGAAVLRIAAARNDLWLDEIWSLEAAGSLHRVTDVFILHHEINHYLNTLWLWFVGGGAPSIEYRAISLVAGIATVAVAVWIMRKRGVAMAMIAAVMFGASYELVVFSSEARGYGVLVLCSLIAYSALAEELERPSRVHMLTFNAAALVGLLSHPLFVTTLAASGTWAIVRIARQQAGPRELTLRIARDFAAPGIAFLILYFIDFRYVVVGGGTQSSLTGVYASGIAWAVGLTGSATWVATGLILAIVGGVNGVRVLMRDQPDVWVFFVGIIAVFPLTFLLLRHSDIVYARHFIVGATFLVLLFTVALGDLWNHGDGGRMTTALIVIAFVASNAIHLRVLLHRGRGQYSAAIRYMASHTDGELTGIGGDHSRRVGSVVRYYLAEAGLPDVYTPSPWTTAPQWIIAHAESFNPPIPGGMEVADNAGNRFTLAQIFPSAPLTGLHWFLYKRIDPASPGSSRSESGGR